MEYVKMSELVDEDFTVESLGMYKFVAWDATNNKYISEDKWFQGAQKKYPVVTNKGKVDMGANHIGAMFEGVQHAGKSDINGCTFHVKSNGKQGKDIRYFVNAVRTVPKPTDTQDDHLEMINREEY